MTKLLVVVDTELNGLDIDHIVQANNLLNQLASSVDLLVCYDLPQPLLLKVLNSLALFDFNQAARELTRAELGPITLRAQAEQIAGAGRQALEERGFEVDTQLHSGDPFRAVKALVQRTQPSQAIFITKPYPIEDSLNISWTNQARDALGLPVLHFHTGSPRLED